MAGSDALKKIGVILLADDAADIGKLDRIHHWQIGLFLYALGYMAECLEILKEVGEFASGLKE